MPPAELSRLIGLQPDDAWRKGDPRGVLRRLAPFDGVEYSSKLDEKRTPRDHFGSLIERLRPYADRIAALAELPSTHSVRIWIVEVTERDNVDTIIEPEEIAVAAAMGAQIAFSEYFWFKEDEASAAISDSR